MDCASTLPGLLQSLSSSSSTGKEGHICAGRDQDSRQLPEDAEAAALATALGDETLAGFATSDTRGGTSGAEPAKAPVEQESSSKRGFQLGYWGSGLRHRLRQPPVIISASNKAITGIQTWQGWIYCASAAGTLKAFDADSGQQASTICPSPRKSQFDVPLEK